MKQVGVELEYFLINDQNEYVCPADIGLDHDQFPLLGEVRSSPSTSMYNAMADVTRQMARVHDIARNNRLIPMVIPEIKIDPTRYRKLMERPDFNKGRAEDRLIDGSEVRLPKFGIVRAGLHIHFSSSHEFTYTVNACKECGKTEQRVKVINDQLDIPSIVNQLDARYATQIRAAKRQFGCYELKTYGFEYRSLPNIIMNPEYSLAYFVEYQLKW